MLWLTHTAFAQYADKLYSSNESKENDAEPEEDEEEDIEAMIAKEVAIISNKPKTQKRFANINVDTDCGKVLSTIYIVSIRYSNCISNCHYSGIHPNKPTSRTSFICTSYIERYSSNETPVHSIYVATASCRENMQLQHTRNNKASYRIVETALSYAC